LQNRNVNLKCEYEEKSWETCATNTTKMKVAKLSAEPKTIGILDFKHTHCAMRLLLFNWQEIQHFIPTASCQADP